MGTSFQQFGNQGSEVPSEGSPDPLFGENVSKNGPRNLSRSSPREDLNTTLLLKIAQEPLGIDF